MSNNVTLESMQAEIERLKAENAALQAKPTKSSPGLSVTPKGTVRVPGIGMFGLCLYQEQWVRLFQTLEVEMPVKLSNFISSNQSKLATKPEGHVSIFAEELKARSAAKAKSKKTK